MAVAGIAVAGIAVLPGIAVGAAVAGIAVGADVGVEVGGSLEQAKAAINIKASAATYSWSLVIPVTMVSSLARIPLVFLILAR